jgi:hypothetical protein
VQFIDSYHYRTLERERERERMREKGGGGERERYFFLPVSTLLSLSLSRLCSSMDESRENSWFGQKKELVTKLSHQYLPKES